MNASDKLRIHELTLKSLEQDITSSEFTELDRLLSASVDNQHYYRQIIDMQIELSEDSEIIAAPMDSNNPFLQEQLWASLAAYEKTAPVQILEDDSEPQVIQRVDKFMLQHQRRKLKKTSLYSIIGSIAAMVSLLISIHFIPPRKASEPVGMFMDSLNAKWANTSMEKGTVIYSNQGSIILTKGIAEFLCEDQTRVLIEAPAEFEFLDINQMALNYGRLYAISSDGSVGFTVDTPGTRIVDLGTEFGIKVEITGETEVHMIKGKASLVIGNSENAQNDIILTEKQARRIDTVRGVSKALTYQGNIFVRKINSKHKIVWRGESINLADIVGGGNGFGTGIIGLAIDPRTGEKFRVSDVTKWEPYKGPQQYMPVRDNDFIDGVFVPDGGSGPVTISTSGLVFSNCPDTVNMFWAGVANGGQYPEPLGVPPKQLHFNNKVYGNQENPGIFMHTNLGITFDLQSIQKNNPEVKITEFRADCGICDNGPSRFPYADFWVLIDGNLRFSRTAVKTGTVNEIILPITDKDRFLTLITTDGGDDVCLKLENDIPIPIDSDWCLFADPVLMLE